MDFFFLFYFPKLIFFHMQGRDRLSLQTTFCTNWIQCKKNELPFYCACLLQNLFDKKGSKLIYKCGKQQRKDWSTDFIKSKESVDLNWSFIPLDYFILHLINLNFQITTSLVWKSAQSWIYWIPSHKTTGTHTNAYSHAYCHLALIILSDLLLFKKFHASTICWTTA